jgi:hypothetical protein
MWRLLSSLWKRPPAPDPPPAPAEEGPAREPFPIVKAPLEGLQNLVPLGPCLGGETFRASDAAGNEVILNVLSRAAFEWPESGPAALLEPYRSLRHRCLLRPLACHIEAERVVLVWESAEENLGDCFHRYRRDGASGIPAAPLLGYLGEAAAAIDYLHSQGLLCPSLRPGSLLLRNGHVRVWDYVTIPLLPRLRSSFSSRYVSPEDLRTKATAASDQYRLALLYFHMRTGRFPFTGAIVFELVMQMTRHDLDLSPLPETERASVDRALDGDPRRRFPSCRDFVQSLKGTVAPDCLQALRGRSRPEPSWLAWNGGTVAKLATAIDDAHDFARLPLLADALEDAGCADAEWLAHLRGPGPHVRGCRALGLLLGGR